MIGVVIPAHNEARRLGRCLKAASTAAQYAAAAGHHVAILVVLDRCTDGTAAVAQRHGAHTFAIEAGNVGMARRAGAEWMLARGATWLACTDADSQVPAHWLTAQLECGAEVVCGTVHVSHWQPWQTAALRKLYLSRYEARDGHRHIHGANLGVSAQAYQSVDGFQPLAAHEDVRLVRDLEALGVPISWSAGHSVATSSRRECRAREGFGDYVAGLQEQLQAKHL